jgi:hypothetical protein
VKRNTDPAFVGLPALKDQERRLGPRSSARSVLAAVADPTLQGDEVCQALRVQTEFESLKSLGRVLMERGETMHYLRDLSWLFRE